MTSIDRILIDPEDEALAAALRQAVAAVNRDMMGTGHVLSFESGADELAGYLRSQPEGAREWRIPGPGPNGVRAALVAIWWSDFLGRRHLRLLGGCHHRGMELPAPIPSPHRPALSCVYPGVCVIASEHRRSRLLAVCDCGAWGPPASLAWMGPSCGPCFDRGDSEPVGRRAVLPATGSVSCVTFSPDGRRLAFWDEEGAVALWDMDHLTAPVRSWYSTSFPAKLAFSGDGADLACQARTNRLWVYEVDGDGVKAGVARSFTFLPDSRSLLVQQAPEGDLLRCPLGSYDEELDGRELYPSGSLIRMPYAIECRDLAVSPDNRTLAAAGNYGLCFWDVHSGAALARGEEQGCVGPLLWSPDGTALACGVGVRLWKAILWDHAQGQRRAVIGEAAALTGLAFTPDGRWLITAEQNTLRAWETRAGVDRRALTLPGADKVVSLALSPDGRTAALGMASGCVRLWPVEMLLPEA